MGNELSTPDKGKCYEIQDYAGPHYFEDDKHKRAVRDQQYLWHSVEPTEN